MNLPPLNEVLGILQGLIGPTFGASLLVFLLVRLLAGERFASLAASVALLVGVFVGNGLREAMPLKIDGERPVSVRDTTLVLGWSLEGKPTPSDDEPTEALPASVPSSYWLLWLSVLALAVEQLARWSRIPKEFGWVCRTLVAVAAGRLLITGDVRQQMPWLPWTFTGITLAIWGLLIHLNRQYRDGALSAGLSLTWAAASVVLLHAHSLKYTDVSLMLFASLLALSLVSWFLPGEMGGAFAFAAIMLPGLMLTAQQDTFSEIPWWCFLLIGIAPLTLLTLAYRPLTGVLRWAVGLGAPMVPASIAVITAMRAEQLPF